MSEKKAAPGRRKRRLLSPEEKWEIFLEVTSQELTQADAARKWGVDASVVIKLRRDVKDAALAVFAASKPSGSAIRAITRSRCSMASWHG